MSLWLFKTRNIVELSEISWNFTDSYKELHLDNWILSVKVWIQNQIYDFLVYHILTMWIKQVIWTLNCSSLVCKYNQYS